MSSDQQAGPVIQTPHIEREWQETFLLEQRLADRSGAEIGDALATVDAHCAESGESAQEAFGDPAAYSRSLVDGGSPRRFRLRSATVAGLALGLFGVVAVPRAVEAWLDGGRVPISGGDLVAVGLALVLAVGLALRPGPFLTWVVRHTWTVFALPFVVLIVLIVPQALWRDTVVEGDWQLVGALGLVALALQVVLTWQDLATPDRVVDPRRPQPRRQAREWLIAFMFPFLTVVVLVMDAVVRAFS